MLKARSYTRSGHSSILLETVLKNDITRGALGVFVSIFILYQYVFLTHSFASTLYNVEDLPFPQNYTITGFNDLGDISYYWNQTSYGTAIYNIYSKKTTFIPDKILQYNYGVGINNNSNVILTSEVWEYTQFKIYNLQSHSLKTIDASLGISANLSNVVITSSNNSNLIGGWYAYNAYPFPFTYNIDTGIYTSLPNGANYNDDGQVSALNDKNVILIKYGPCTGAVSCLYNSNNHKSYDLPIGYDYISINNKDKIIACNGTGASLFNFDTGIYDNLTFNDNYMRKQCPQFLNNFDVIIGYDTDKAVYFVATPAATKPEIMYNGNNIAGSASPISVVVGQQIILNAVLPDSFGPVASQSWKFDGNPIGGYSPSSAAFQTGQVLPLTSNLPVTKVYWPVPTSAGQNYNVEYSYTLKSGQSGTIKTKFAVTPPPSAVGKASYGTPSQYWIYSSKPGNLFMGFGNYISGLYGMTFSTTTDSMGGTFKWVQLVNHDVYDYYFSNGKLGSECTTKSGLDAGSPQEYPYDSGSKTTDSPAIGLYSTYAKVARFFSAQMYLMWQANIPNSIPVPIGSMTWGFSETSHFESGAYLDWSLPLVKVDPVTFYASAQYPIWDAPAVRTCK